MEKIIKPGGLGGPEEPEESMHRVRRARRFMWISAALLFVSLVAVIASTSLEGSRIVPYLMWNHVAIIVVCAYRIFTARKTGNRSSKRISPRPGELFSGPILVVALVAAIVAVPNWVDVPWDTGRAPDGSIATSHSWHTSSDGTRYYENFNRGDDHEITAEQYEKLNRGVYSFFSRMWVLFSFLALMMWRFEALGIRDGASKPENQVTASSALARGNGSPEWKSTALIVTIWTLVIGANLLNLTRGRDLEFCSMPTPPGMQWAIVAMPIVFLPVTALFMKPSSFVSPWIASLIDEYCGAGSSTNFMARLKPLLLFSIAGLISSAVMAKDCWQGGKGSGDWTIPGFLLSASVAFALTHLILRWRRIPGFLLGSRVHDSRPGSDQSQ